MVLNLYHNDFSYILLNHVKQFVSHNEISKANRLHRQLEIFQLTAKQTYVCTDEEDLLQSPSPLSHPCDFHKLRNFFKKLFSL